MMAAPKLRKLPTNEMVILRPKVQIEDEQFLFPMKKVASLLGISISTFGKLGLKPVAARGQERLYYLPEVINIRMGGDGTRLDPGQERARLHKARREQIETDLRKEKGELVEVEEVLATFEKEIAIVRQYFLALPSKVARPLAHTHTAKEAEAIVRDALYRAMENLEDARLKEFP